MLWKSVWRLIKNLKRPPIRDPAIPLLGIYLKDSTPICHRGSCTSRIIAVLFTVVKLWNQARGPRVEEFIKIMHFGKHSGIQKIHNGRFLAIKREVMQFSGKWIQLERITVSELSQSLTDIICFHIDM